MDKNNQAKAVGMLEAIQEDIQFHVPQRVATVYNKALVMMNEELKKTGDVIISTDQGVTVISNDFEEPTSLYSTKLEKEIYENEVEVPYVTKMDIVNPFADSDVTYSDPVYNEKMNAILGIVPPTKSKDTAEELPTEKEKSLAKTIAEVKEQAKQQEQKAVNEDEENSNLLDEVIEQEQTEQQNVAEKGTEEADEKYAEKVNSIFETKNEEEIDVTNETREKLDSIVESMDITEVVEEVEEVEATEEVEETEFLDETEDDFLDGAEDDFIDEYVIDKDAD